jgi:hypothetical protein
LGGGFFSPQGEQRGELRLSIHMPQPALLVTLGDFWARLLSNPSPEGSRFVGSSPLTVVATMACCTGAFFFFTHTGILVPKTSSTGRKLLREEHFEWSLRLVSTITSVVLVGGTFYGTCCQYLVLVDATI